VLPTTIPSNTPYNHFLSFYEAGELFPNRLYGIQGKAKALGSEKEAKGNGTRIKNVVLERVRAERRTGNKKTRARRGIVYQKFYYCNP
jgi:hypothetical protein